MKVGVKPLFCLLMLLCVLAPASARAQEAADRNPIMVVRPSGEMFAFFFPPAALAQGVSGRVVIDCFVGLDQRLINCTVTEEAPDGWGFAEAALAMSRSFRVAPAIVNGLPVEGGRIRIPNRFSATGGGDQGGLDIPVWEDAPSPAAVRTAAAPMLGSAARGRSVLSCRANEDRTLSCEVVRESAAGLGAVALALAGEFRIASEESEFIARHRDAPFMLPINFGFGEGMEPVNMRMTGLTPFEVASPPPEIVEAFYPEAARSARLAGSASVTCTAHANSRFNCRISSEMPTGNGFGEAAMRLAAIFSQYLSDSDAMDFFLEGDEWRMTVPFEPPSQ